MLRRSGQSGVRWLVFTAIVLAAGAGVAVYLQFSRPAVSVTTVEIGPVVQAFYSTGTIQPVREFPIKSNTAGILTDVKVDKGDAVRKGEILAMVSDPALQYAVDKAQAELQEKLQRADEQTSPVLLEFDAKIRAMDELLQIARREVKRLEEAMASNASSQSNLDVALDRLQRVWSEQQSLVSQKAAKKLELQRDAEVARAALKTAQWNLDEQTLRAPIDGVVLDRPTSLGTRVAINDRIMRIADVAPERLVMRAAVDEEDVTKVQLGQTVRMSLYAFEGDVLTGKVARIYDQADSERRTFEVDVEMAEARKHLQPGMTGELVFILSQKEGATVVPAQAVQKSQDKEWIYIVRDGRLDRIEPVIGLRSIERIEVIQGVRRGDVVVLTPLGGAAGGTRVKVKERLDPRIAAGLNKPPPEGEPFRGF